MKYRVTYDLIVEADNEDEAVREARLLLDDPSIEPVYVAVYPAS